MKSVEFLGYIFTQDGLKPSPDKVKALEEAEPPESKEALRSFLGMMGWNQRFIEQFSEMSTVLYDLLNEKDSFKWKYEHQQAFDAIRRSLTKETMLRYFEKGKKAAFSVDAGKKAHKIGDRGGMSAIMAQKYQDCWRPIYFARRRLTDVESRWGQTELEARAVKWGAAEKFGEFPVSAPTFQIFTDAKSLVPLFNKASRKAPPRIERQILGMQHLDFTLVYSPGKNNPADFMSRNPSDTESSYIDKVTDELEESIIKMVKNKEKAGVSKNLKDVRKKDKMMIFLKERTLQEDWKSTRRTL